MLADLGPLNDITSRIIGAAIEVHRVLGPGLLQSAYFACLIYELQRDGFAIERERSVPVTRPPAGKSEARPDPSVAPTSV